MMEKPQVFILLSERHRSTYIGIISSPSLSDEGTRRQGEVLFSVM